LLSSVLRLGIGDWKKKVHIVPLPHSPLPTKTKCFCGQYKFKSAFIMTLNHDHRVMLPFWQVLILLSDRMYYH